MAAFDVPSDIGLRTSASPELLNRAAQQADASRQADTTLIACALILLAAVAIVAAYYAVRERRRIAGAADAAVIASLAAGVRGARKLASAKNRLVDRVSAKANELLPPSTD